MDKVRAYVEQNALKMATVFRQSGNWLRRLALAAAPFVNISRKWNWKGRCGVVVAMARSWDARPRLLPVSIVCHACAVSWPWWKVSGQRFLDLVNGDLLRTMHPVVAASTAKRLRQSLDEKIEQGSPR